MSIASRVFVSVVLLLAGAIFGIKQLDKKVDATGEQGKPAVWFLPLEQPISPHLDELLGPVENEER